MKKIKLITLLSLTIFLFCCESPNTKRHVDNINKIKLGMHYREVEKYMGIPNNITMFNIYDSTYILLYSSPFAASDHYRIIISKKDTTVVKISYGD